MGTIVVMAALVAVAAAARSTYSPCGLSMLSTVIPMAEAARGHRYRSTAAFFWIGAVLGGATLGLGAACLAALVSLFGASGTATTALAGLAAVAALALDARLIGPPLPHHRRQVDEDWLNRYRSWVYGGGFGWQIGTGLSTYIMTAAVYLVIALAALTASPVAAFWLCVLFGALRGSAVLLGARLTDADALRRFHARFDALREPVRIAAMVVEGIVAAVAAVVVGAPAGIAVGAALVVCAVAAAATALRRARTTDLSTPAASVTSG
jgi:hypothetical protein